MKNLILAGDSWTYLWYDQIPNYEIAPDLKPVSTFPKNAVKYQELLYRGYGFNVVNNAGRPGGNTPKTIEDLNIAFDVCTGTDYVVFYFTETVRSPMLTSTPSMKIETLVNALQNKELFFETLTEFCIADLLDLGHVVNSHIQRLSPNLQVLLIGGLEKITPYMMQRLQDEIPEAASRMHVVVPSAMEFLLKLYNPDHFDMTTLKNINYSHFYELFHNLVSESTDEALIDQFINNNNLREEVRRVTPLIWPDGGHHTNATGQFLIFNEVIKKINEIEKN